MAAGKFITDTISRLFPAETAHKIILTSLRFGAADLLARRQVADISLRQELCGLKFDNPLGMAAGFDKEGKAYKGLLALGFGFVEVGSVTLQPQKGNLGKRLFRLRADQAVINRLGMPGGGMKKLRPRLKDRLKNNKHHVLGVNIAYNSQSQNIHEDYRKLAAAFADRADYITVNVSCPNIEGGANLQSSEYLPPILQAVQEGVRGIKPNVPIMLKLSPDVSEEELHYICTCAKQNNIAALIIGNTTLTRPADLRSPYKSAPGGLSGKPLFALSTQKLAQAYLLLQGALPLIGVGGISSAEDAYNKIKAGANLLQLYTGLIYWGPSLIDEILQGLPHLLQKDGYAHISDAVGAEAKKWAQS